MSAEPADAPPERAPERVSDAALVPALTLVDTPDMQEISRVMPGSAPVDVMAQLRELAARANELRDNRKAPNTARAHESDWRLFEQWCRGMGLDPLPAAPEVVALYVAAHAGVHASGTIRRRLGSVSVRHKEADYDSPVQTQLVREVIDGLFRMYPAAPKKKAAMRTKHLRAMVRTLDVDTLAGARNRALLVIDFACAFRRSEVAGIDVEHVTEEPDGLLITLPKSKTSRGNEEPESVAAPWGSDPLTCPVRAWRHWLEVSGITEGPAFRPISRWGVMSDKRMSGAAFNELVQRLATAAGYDGKAFGGHSGRRGLITEAAVNDVPERDIARTTRHKSVATLRGYMEFVDKFQRNAAARVGL